MPLTDQPYSFAVKTKQGPPPDPKSISISISKDRRISQFLKNITFTSLQLTLVLPVGFPGVIGGRGLTVVGLTVTGIGVVDDAWGRVEGASVVVDSGDVVVVWGGVGVLVGGGVWGGGGVLGGGGVWDGGGVWGGGGVLGGGGVWGGGVVLGGGGVWGGGGVCGGVTGACPMYFRIQDSNSLTRANTVYSLRPALQVRVPQLTTPCRTYFPPPCSQTNGPPESPKQPLTVLDPPKPPQI